MSNIRRIFFYAVSLITLGIFAAGVQALLRLLFGLIGGTAARVETAGYNVQQLSLGLAMVLIGGGLWFVFWRSISGQVNGNIDETGSAMRKLYLNFIATISAIVTLQTGATFLAWLLSGVPLASFPAGSLATLLVTDAIWTYHLRMGEKEGHPSPAARTLRRWYVYILSAWGLVGLALNLVFFLYDTILHLPFWGSQIVSSGYWTNSLQLNVAWVIIGAGAWWFHWLRLSGDDSESVLRQVYLYLVTILGSAVAGLTALTTTLFALFRFAMGGLDVSASVNFMPLGWAVPAILVSSMVWIYHQQVVADETGGVYRSGFSARRVLHYLMSFIGLATSITGLIMLFGLIFELLASLFSKATLLAVSPGWWRQQSSLVLALLIVGIPLWIYYWRKVLLMVQSGGVTEWRARSRRIFLYIVVGVAIITLAADLVNIIYQLLNGLLQGQMGLEVYKGLKWSLQSGVVAAPVLVYHWRVLRQHLGPSEEKQAAPKTITLLTGEPGADLITRIEGRTGSRIKRLRFLGRTGSLLPYITDAELDRLVEEIQSTPGDKVLLVAVEGKISVLPYQED